LGGHRQATIANYVEDAYSIAVPGHLLRDGELSEITIELGLLEFPLQSSANIQEIISNSQGVSVTLTVTKESQYQVVSPLVTSVPTVRALSCLCLEGFPSDLQARNLQSNMNTIAEACARAHDMQIQFGEDALSRVDLHMFGAFASYGYNKTALHFYMN
jgi:hypothetical protein